MTPPRGNELIAAAINSWRESYIQKDEIIGSPLGGHNYLVSTDQGLKKQSAGELA
jgi:hypothetical protein